ncbi:Putative disease resistance protein RGA3 [Linum perenne]
MATDTTQQILKEVRSFFSSSNQVAYGLKIAHGIQAIRGTLDDIAERREMFHLEVRPVESMAEKHRDHTHSDVPQVVVGREADKRKILNLLFQPSKDNVSVVPIVGIGGLGKTTLAQLVFNDASVESFFEHKIWVCISDNFDVKLIVEKIIESCTKVKPGKELQMDTLRELLHENVKGKKYLIVFDDVWNEDREKWSCLKSLLKGGAEGSRIMITTRLYKVAKLATSMEPYEFKGLNEMESWSLFREIAFEGGQVVSRKQEIIGREILAKCKGVPLAIKTIAGALFFKETESEWFAFKSSDIWKMEQNENDIMPTLKLSYDHLPTHLKHCFAYCRLFPKDCEFDVKKLIQLWVAQGYVKKSSSDSSDQFDIGLEYFKDLLWRSFFQETVKDEQGFIKSCKMHDLMHDLAIVVAGEEAVALDISNPTNKLSREDLKKIRHVSLDFECSSSSAQLLKLQWTSVVNNAEKLRTLFCSDQDRLESWEVFDGITFFNTTSLRALDLSYFRMSILSNTVHKLKHLRYLNLTNNHMTMLPEEITELVNLEVLELEKCVFLKELPRNTGNLLSLAHLGLNGCRDLKSMPLGIGRLSCLRELTIFLIADGETAGIGELRYLNNLRGILKIKNLQWVKNPSEGEEANLSGKQYLEQLELSWGWNKANSDVAAEGQLLEALRPNPNLKVLRLHDYGGMKSPSWIPSLTSLVVIEIVNSKKWKRLLPLDQLPFLEKLELRKLDSLEWIETLMPKLASSTSFFPCLKSLKIDTCPKLKGWWVPAKMVVPEFARVCDLEISNCNNITSIPHFSLLHLEYVSLFGGNKELLKQILSVSLAHCSSSSPPCCHLQDLYINNMDDLDTLPEEILPCLSSLKTLSIMNCGKLKTLYPALPHQLTSLHNIEIESCDELDLLHDYYDINAAVGGSSNVLLPNLHSVNFVEIKKLSSLLQVAPCLEEILTANCPISRIPEWMPNLTQLQDLTIYDYEKPAAKFVDEDLTMVAHVPRILINDVCIMSNGCFNESWADNGEEDDDDIDDDDHDDDDIDDDDHDDDDEAGGGGGETVKEASRLIELFKHAQRLLRTSCCTTLFLRCFGGSSSSSATLPCTGHKS